MCSDSWREILAQAGKGRWLEQGTRWQKEQVDLLKGEHTKMVTAMGRKRHNFPGILLVPVAVIIWQNKPASSNVCFLCKSQAVVYIISKQMAKAPQGP